MRKGATVKKIVEYECWDIINSAGDVDKRIAEGWQPHGSPCVDGDGRVYQAIVRYENTIEPSELEAVPIVRAGDAVIFHVGNLISQEDTDRVVEDLGKQLAPHGVKAMLLSNDLKIAAVIAADQCQELKELKL
jgi:hypothetical protein